MEIVLYKNMSEPNRLNKDIRDPAQVNGYLRDASAIINPVLRISMSADDLINYDYLYIPLWNRYYYISDYVSVRAGITDISCAVDVLMSYRSDINDLTVIVDKQEYNGSVYINDGSWISEEREFYTIKNFQNGFNDTGEYILITAGA